MKREILSLSSPAPVSPYSEVVKAGDMLYISGQMSERRPDGSKPSIQEQTADAMNSLKRILEEVGSSMDNIVKCTVHLSDRKYFSAMNEVYAAFFKNGYPARLCVYNIGLYDELDIEIDAIAIA